MLNSVLKNRYQYNEYFYSANPFVTPEFGYDNFDKQHIEDGSIGLFYTIPPDIKKTLWLMDNKKSGFEKFSSTSLELIKNMKLKSMIKWYVSLLFNGIIAKRYVFKKIHSILTNFPREKGVTSITTKILEEKMNEPYFLFINLMEPHEPYDLKKDWIKSRVINLKTDKIDLKRNAEWKESYENNNEYVINKSLSLLNKIELNQKTTNSITIITSDHGQLFGEHNKMGHQTFLNDELLKVPFYIKTSDKYPIKNIDDNPKSIVNIKNMILKALKNGYIDIKELTGEVIYAETFGINLQIQTKDPDEKKNIEKYDKYRIRAVSSKEDTVFNVAEFKYEDVNFNEIKEQPKIHPNILYYLKNNLKKSL